MPSPSAGGLLAVVVDRSLRYRSVLVVLAGLALVYGGYVLSNAPTDVFPEFAPPEVSLQAEAPGLSPEQVEVLVTQPIENALNGMPGIRSLRSQSIQGVSVVTVAFNRSSDLYRDRQAVAERLAAVSGDLPRGFPPPRMAALTSSTGDLMSVGFTSDRLSLVALRTIVDWTVRPRLLAVPGVAQASSFGGRVRELQIQVDPSRLVRDGLSLEEIRAAAEQATGVRGAGFIDTPNQRILLETTGAPMTAAALARIAVRRRGAAVLTLGDVARVRDAWVPPFSSATVQGKPGVVVNVWAQYGTNTLATTRAVDRALAELEPALKAQGVVMDSTLFRSAKFIRVATDHVRTSLLLGALLVLGVLFLFLADLRTAAISCTAIPLSLLTAAAVMSDLGMTLNTMTLGGLAIAIGEVVDDAVIGVENVMRRLRDHRRDASPMSPFRVVLDATIEVRSAVVFATFAVALVFVPVLTMTGLAGRLFAPLGVAYILAVLASLVVAVTVTPALCLLLLRDPRRYAREPAVTVRMKRTYATWLGLVERRPRLVLGGIGIFTLGGLLAIPFLKTQFLPRLREGHFIVHMTAVPGTSLDESQRLGTRVTRALLKLPEVRSVAQRIGRAASDDTFGPHESELEVDLRPLAGTTAREAEDTLRAALRAFPGVGFEVNTFLAERVAETLTGFTAPVVLNLFGNDLDLLDEKAAEAARILGSVRGAVDVRMQSPSGLPQWSIRLRPYALERWGFRPVEVLDAVRTAYEGDTVGQIYDGNQRFDLAMLLPPELRSNPVEVGALPLRSPEGPYVPLKRLADLEETSGRYVVLHEDARRVQTVTCGVAGRALGDFVRDAKRRIRSRLTLPPGTYAQFTGTAEEEARSRRDLLVHASLAGVGIVLLLWVVMGAARNVLLILVNLPFALVGGVLAAVFTGGSLSVGAMVGFVTLFGITLRNSILLLAHYDHLVAEEAEPWNAATAIRGAAERLTPILMTALVTALGLLPMALGSGGAGREIEGPMAIVILGGLTTSTALNLLVLPTLALRYGRFPIPRARDGESEPD